MLSSISQDCRDILQLQLRILFKVLFTNQYAESGVTLFTLWVKFSDVQIQSIYITFNQKSLKIFDLLGSVISHFMNSRSFTRGYGGKDANRTPNGRKSSLVTIKLKQLSSIF